MTEILAPAGTEEAFYAALKAGADAVYLGGARFGARAYAQNFEQPALLEAIDEAHLFGKKIYLTVNTLFKESETEELYSFLLPFYKAGLDAVIVQDLGAFDLIRTAFPKMHIHASTQMTVTGWHGAAFLKNRGADRVIPARELSIEEIRQINAHTDIEIECFVHGALCYCYSGQCLMSSMAGGRSGNRGRCAQPCRLPYTVSEKGKVLSSRENAYALNTKDICALRILPELIEAGIDSFKIEGRMKRPEYTAGVVSVYRKYRDLALSSDRYEVEKEDVALLSSLFNRDGFSQSYYHMHNGPEMMALCNRKRSVSDNRETEKAYLFVKESILDTDLKKDVSAGLKVTKEGASLSIYTKEAGGSAFCAEVFPAKTAGLTAESLKKQIQKTGGTPYRIRFESVETEPDLFMTVKAQNELRRQALADFRKNVLKAFCEGRKAVPEHRTDTFSCDNERIGPDRAINQKESKRIEVSVHISTKEQLLTALNLESADEICVPERLARFVIQNRFYESDGCRRRFRLSFASPVRKDEKERIDLINKAAEDGWCFLAGSLEEVSILLEKGLAQRIRLDAGVYTMNRRSRAFFAREGISKDTVPLELNRREIQERDNKDSELLIYGRIPLMISAQCLKKNYDRCTGDDSHLTLTDRKNYIYPVVCDCASCRNIIYNPFPVSLLSKKNEVLKTGVSSCRFSFTDESADVMARLIREWEKERPAEEDFPFTRGHFSRGVE